MLSTGDLPSLGAARLTSYPGTPDELQKAAEKLNQTLKASPKQRLLGLRTKLFGNPNLRLRLLSQTRGKS